MVLVALGHPRHARDPLIQVARVVAQRALERVRLDVGLVDDVHAELVGQVEEGRVVRVVRGPDGVGIPNCFIRMRSGTHDSTEMTRPVCWSKSWRFTPRMNTPGRKRPADPGRGSRPAGSRLERRFVRDLAARHAEDDAKRDRAAARPRTSVRPLAASIRQVTSPSSGGAIRRKTVDQRDVSSGDIGSPGAARWISR